MIAKKTNDEYRLHVGENTCSTIFEIEREEFYKLFLRCHNSSKTRVQFADILESEYLKSKNIEADRLTVWHGDIGYWRWDPQKKTHYKTPNEYLYGGTWREWVRKNYLLYTDKCYDFFEVRQQGRWRLDHGDWDAPKRALRRRHFESKPELTIVTSAQYVEDDCDGLDDYIDNDYLVEFYINGSVDCYGREDSGIVALVTQFDFDMEEE
jgi:hypothetical protein